ncbi:MAG: hypothetical protein ACR2KQ_08650 [Actinomycetota bacterium]
MAALAYLLLPVSGLIAFLFSSDPRVSFHGVQAIVFGTLWAVTLYGASVASPVVTQVVAVLGVVVWLILLVGAAAGRDPALPGLRRMIGYRD